MADLKISELTEITSVSLGFAKSVSISKKESIVSAGKNKKEINEKLVELKSQMEVADENEKEKLKKIISKLENGIATLRIGGENVQETKEKKYKLEDRWNPDNRWVFVSRKSFHFSSDFMLEEFCFIKIGISKFFQYLS
ncbi:MAG: hypothetical protein COU40_01665 [Candidatus Moranbacteria bacterium CG10_big_fil_rev_8_21_14_0_10_35_21]|nr:MAG: hypothetical protein COU40_01665 [Candidatus Moranbacteria bacterium CG10_big_fil_rev_8_21_14_0_10_35_21]PJA88739.1 MAG: hypothetical protein CO139_01440 [Candidatus Moranbacteria bacterium CG_4_9_14_3_um_filter_36_9]